MAHALHGIGNGLPVQNLSGSQLQFQLIALPGQAAEHFRLDLAHEPQLDLPQAAVPGHMQLRVLFPQFPELGQHRHGIRSPREQHPVGQHRLGAHSPALRH